MRGSRADTMEEQSDADIAIELVKRAWACVNNCDFHSLLDLLSSDVIWETSYP